MSNENPNNDFHWKSKLEGLENLPGEAFNKEELWDNLHGRLHKKNANKKLIWLYAAAACLLIALLLSWFFTNKKEDVLVKNSVRKNQDQKSNSAQSASIKKNAVEIIPSIAVEKISITKKVEQEKIITAIDHKTLPIESVAAKQDEEKFIEPKIINAATTIDSQINIAVVIPGKKKLRVVHINELGDPLEELPAMARKTEIHSFQMKFANQEVFVTSSAFSTKARFNIFSTKPSPN